MRAYPYVENAELWDYQKLYGRADGDQLIIIVKQELEVVVSIKS